MANSGAEKSAGEKPFDGTDLCFSCSQNSNPLSVTAFDISTGAVLKTYSCDNSGRSNTSTQSTNSKIGRAASLCLLGKTYLLCSSNTTPFIYVWNLKRERLQVKISCLGLLGALACSPEGTYCAGAIGEKIHIWEVSTGHLLAVVGQHYQPINVLRFTDDGVHLLSGGEDARVIVWSVSSILSEAYTSSNFRIPNAPPLTTPLLTHSHAPLTRHIWSDHSLPVTDIHCGSGGLRCRVATVSLDQTCKLYEVSSGQLLCSFLFDFGLTRVAMDLAEYWLFVGGTNGDIAQINLFNKVDGHLKDISQLGQERKNIFKGHSKAITGLGVSRWKYLLVSTSEEDTARVWDIGSHQCLRAVKLKGIVSSMMTTGSVLQLSSPPGGQHEHLQHEVPPIKPFQKRLYYSSDAIGADLVPSSKDGGNRCSDVVPISLRGMNPLSDRSLLRQYECCFTPPTITPTKDNNSDLSLHGVRQELSEILDVHKKLYSFVMKETISD